MTTPARLVLEKLLRPNCIQNDDAYYDDRDGSSPPPLAPDFENVHNEINNYPHDLFYNRPPCISADTWNRNHTRVYPSLF